MTARTAPSGLLLVLGVVVVQMVRTDAYLRYVKSWLALPLLVSGTALVLLGAAGVFAAFREQHGDRLRPSQAGWLLVVPVGLVVLVDPPALGSYGLQGNATVVSAPQEPLTPLPPPRAGAVELTLGDYARRAAFDPAGLDDARLRLVGFAVPPTPEETARHGSGFYLTRIALNCCAADGRPARVFVRTAHSPAADTWWRVEGRATPTAGTSVTQRARADALVVADVVTAIEAPRNPYSY